VGEEPNITMRRKPGSILYSILSALSKGINVKKTI
jgi:hypothetical protein